ncbi:MAG: hypothetical protein WBZ42_01365 [Halobacteriota archaeon]
MINTTDKSWKSDAKSPPAAKPKVPCIILYLMIRYSMLTPLRMRGGTKHELTKRFAAFFQTRDVLIL